jgi:hypothetical protein
MVLLALDKGMDRGMDRVKVKAVQDRWLSGKTMLGAWGCSALRLHPTTTSTSTSTSTSRLVVDMTFLRQRSTAAVAARKEVYLAR